MCVIIQINKDQEMFPRREFISALGYNRDGIGILTYDEENGLCVTKSVKRMKAEEAYEMVKAAVAGKDALVHLRMATHGSVNTDNCHPFPVLEESDERTPIWMMHNGVISGVKCGPDESDTRAFVREFLRPLLLKHSDLDLMNDEKLQSDLHKVITGNRLAFMDGKGSIAWVGGMNYLGYNVSNASYFNGGSSSMYGGGSWYGWGNSLYDDDYSVPFEGGVKTDSAASTTYTKKAHYPVDYEDVAEGSAVLFWGVSADDLESIDDAVDQISVTDDRLLESMVDYDKTGATNIIRELAASIELYREMLSQTQDRLDYLHSAYTFPETDRKAQPDYDPNTEEPLEESEGESDSDYQASFQSCVGGSNALGKKFSALNEESLAREGLLRMLGEDAAIKKVA